MALTRAVLVFGSPPAVCRAILRDAQRCGATRTDSPSAMTGDLVTNARWQKRFVGSRAAIIERYANEFRGSLARGHGSARPGNGRGAGVAIRTSRPPPRMRLDGGGALRLFPPAQ